MADRITDTNRFYELLDRLSELAGGPRVLKDCHGGMNWPARGVYFFYEAGESRADDPSRSRVVRIGTHGLRNGSRSTLWDRLSQHRGNIRSGRGNHRGSIFRLIVGIALAKQLSLPLPDSWGVGGSVGEAARRLNIDRDAINAAESDLEASVSEYIGLMPFLWLDVGDAPGPNSERGLIERNAIALLSGYRGGAVDNPSDEWLGHHSDRERVRRSGLWNNNHVDELDDPLFLDEMESRIESSDRRQLVLPACCLIQKGY